MRPRWHVLLRVLLEFLKFVDVLVYALSSRVVLVFDFALNLDICLLEVDQLMLLYRERVRVLNRKCV